MAAAASILIASDESSNTYNSNEETAHELGPKVEETRHCK